MEDFASILVRDYGLKPQGKSAPMSSTKVSPSVGSSRGSGYGSDRKGSVSGRMSGNVSSFGGQEDGPYLSRKNGSTKMSGRSSYGGGGGGDDIFSPGNYDDVFGGPPKSTPAGPRYDDVFGEVPDSGRAPVYDDVFAGLGVNESKGNGSSPRVGSPRRSDRSNFSASEPTGFDELLPGFSSEPAKSRSSGDAVAPRDGDPFVSPLINDPLDTTPSNSNSAPFIDPMDVFTVPLVPPVNTNTDAPHASSSASGAFDGFDIFDGYTNQSVDASKPRESSQSSRDDVRKLVEDLNSNQRTEMREQSPTDETEPSEGDLPTVEPIEAYNISSKSSPFFSFTSDDGLETAAPSVSSSKLGDDGLLSSSLDSPVPFKARSRSSPFRDVKEKWLTVNDMKLVTKPSSVPPPSRPPPVPGSGRHGSRSRVDHMESSGQEDRFTSASWPSANTASAAYGNSSEEEQTGGGTPGGSRKDFFGRMDHKTNAANHSGDDEKDVEEDTAAIKAREKDRQEKERQEREAKEAEAREDKERERARRYKEKEREREKDRAAVQRVTLEARERAAQEARDRAQRTAVERATAEARERAAQQAQERAVRERAAVEKANAEARERAEQRAVMEKAAKERAEQRAAVERAAAEARERAERVAVERTQAEVRERAQRTAAERVVQDIRQREERATADRAAQEARQRAAAEARERAERADKEAAEKAARERREQEQRKSEHDLDAFFNPGLHSTPPSSEPKRSSSVNNMSNMSFDSNAVRRSMNNSRPSSVPSGDYLRSLLDDPVPQPTSNSGEDPTWNKRSGASDRSRERAKQALENIRKREAEMQREQAEKHRAADQLDAEIKRWAAGKEGNLRALLSTLQYVVWPECSWQPVSLSDLITAASVKKVYRKATLVLHPDKVQQKGATVQQKYIAEKVFDLLKEAWNKFNSEELF